MVSDPRRSFSVPLTVLNESSEPVASGQVGQGSLQLPSGRYEVVVQAPSAPVTVRGIYITSNRTTRVLLEETPDGIEASVQLSADPRSPPTASTLKRSTGVTIPAGAPSGPYTTASGEPQ